MYQYLSYYVVGKIWEIESDKKNLKISNFPFPPKFVFSKISLQKFLTTWYLVISNDFVVLYLNHVNSMGLQG